MFLEIIKKKNLNEKEELIIFRQLIEVMNICIIRTQIPKKVNIKT